jgi:ribosome-binding factor A
MSHKPDQLAAEIQKAVQEVLARGLSDPRITGLITITKARVQADLKRAELFVSVLPVERQSLTMHGLHSAEKHIRRQISDMIRTRSIPELVFVLDGSLKKEAAVLEDLRKIKDEEEAKPAIEAELPKGFAPAPAPSTKPSPSGWPAKDHA